MSLPQYVTINGTSYASENLNEAAKTQAQNIQAVDAELARLQQQIAIAQTARNAYAQALIESVKSAKNAASAKSTQASAKSKAPAVAAAAVVAAETPKKPRAPRKPKAAAPAAA